MRGFGLQNGVGCLTEWSRPAPTSALLLPGFERARENAPRLWYETDGRSPGCRRDAPEVSCASPLIKGGDAAMSQSTSSSEGVELEALHAHLCPILRRFSWTFDVFERDVGLGE
jgi:hypothetical protein